MALVADQDDVTPFACISRHLHVHFGHERAGSVEHFQRSPLRFVLHRARYAVGAEDDRRIIRHFVQFLDENRAQVAQTIDDITVVHDLVTHVDGRAEQFYRTLDDVDGAIDAGAETTGIGEKNLHFWK